MFGHDLPLPLLCELYQVNRYKARLDVLEGQQEYPVNYFETYANVVTWPSVRTLLTLSIIRRWCTRQIDYVLAIHRHPFEFDFKHVLKFVIFLEVLMSQCQASVENLMYDSVQLIGFDNLCTFTYTADVVSIVLSFDISRRGLPIVAASSKPHQSHLVDYAVH